MKKISFCNQYRSGIAWLNPANVVSIVKTEGNSTYKIYVVANPNQMYCFENVSEEDVSQFIGE